MINNRYFISSLVFHGLIVAFSLVSIKGCGGSQDKQGVKEGNGGDAQADIVDPPSMEVVMTSDLTEEDSEALKKKAFEKRLGECKNFFGGVGITFSDPFTAGTVHKYYPAYRAGIRPGDFIANAGELRGEIGSKVVVKVYRNEKPIEFNLIRGKICMKDL